MSQPDDDDDEIQMVPLKPSFLQLNEHCFFELFERTDILSLNVLARSCKFINSCSTLFFAEKYKKFDAAAIGKHMPFIEVSDFAKTMMTFGVNIEDLRVSRNEFPFNQLDEYDAESTKVLESIGKYCIALEGLHLVGIIFDWQIRELLNGFFAVLSSVEKLQLDGCIMGGMQWWEVSNLKVLKLNNIDLDESFYAISFANLEEIELNHNSIDQGSLEGFVSAAPMLKKLRIINCSGCTTKIMNTIPNLTDLEQFDFQLNRPYRHENNYRADIMHLANIKKLKVLNLNCDQHHVQTLIDGFGKARIALENLELAWGQIGVSIIEAIGGEHIRSQFKSFIQIIRID